MSDNNKNNLKQKDITNQKNYKFSFEGNEPKFIIPEFKPVTKLTTKQNINVKNTKEKVNDEK